MATTFTVLVLPDDHITTDSCYGFDRFCEKLNLEIESSGNIIGTSVIFRTCISENIKIRMVSVTDSSEQTIDNLRRYDDINNIMMIFDYQKIKFSSVCRDYKINNKCITKSLPIISLVHLKDDDIVLIKYNDITWDHIKLHGKFSDHFVDIIQQIAVKESQIFDFEVIDSIKIRKLSKKLETTNLEQQIEKSIILNKSYINLIDNQITAEQMRLQTVRHYLLLANTKLKNANLGGKSKITISFEDKLSPESLSILIDYYKQNGYGIILTDNDFTFSW